MHHQLHKFWREPCSFGTVAPQEIAEMLHLLKGLNFNCIKAFIIPSVALSAHVFLTFRCLQLAAVSPEVNAN